MDWGQIASAQVRILRIVTYNIEADINGVTMPLPGLIAPVNDTNNVQAGGVLEGIGEEISGADSAQPIDILALQETTSNPVTIAPIVSGLNAFYAYHTIAATYTNSTYQATESGGATGSGNGPNALVYNTRTLQLLASVPVNPPGGISKLGSNSGEYRQVMRYAFAPAGIAATTTNTFYVYVSHYKSSASGTEATNQLYRAAEAAFIRDDAATNLPSNPRILYVGDYNLGGSDEAQYQILVSNAAPNGVMQGQGIDPLNPSGANNIDWTANSLLNNKTDASTSLHYRDDFELMTTNIYYGSGNGLKWVSGTYHTFGNNGTTPYKASVTSAANTSLNSKLAPGSIISAATLYQDLASASDHLPVVADYTIPVPAPVIMSVSRTGANLIFNVNNAATNGTYICLMTTNVWSQPTNATAVMTNISGGNAFAFTLTNAVDRNASSRFYRILYP
ncbi:MAG TPA: hypothetical protein VGO57_05990 [Verrucomicrobiae bacterium]|jgi:hypothetical protein